MGRLVEKKGFLFLVEACRLLKDRGHRFRCTIIGGGVKEQELHGQISALDLNDTVVLAGPLSSDAVIEAIGRSLMLVLPCIVAEDGNQDALPTVMLEAMALGRPVVSTDLPGVTEIVDQGGTGFMAPQRNSPALAEAMERLLADADLRVAFGQAGRRKAEQLFDLRRNAGELAALFRGNLEACEPEFIEAVGQAAGR